MIEESVKKDAALLVLNQYKSYLMACQKAIAIKEGKSEFGLFPHKHGGEERWVVTEATGDTDFTFSDCLKMWKLFLIKALKIPEDRIEFCHARTGNSTTLVFKLAQTHTEDINEKLFKPAAMWVMKELGILRVNVPGMVDMNIVRSSQMC